MAAIARTLGERRTTVQAWKTRDQWNAASPLQKVEASIEARLCALIAKSAKEGIDFKEIDLLGRQLERTARVRRYEAGGTEADLNPNIAKRNAVPKRRPEKKRHQHGTSRAN